MSTIIGTLLIFLISLNGNCAKYEPNWASLDSRLLPEWYDRAKIGIFLHWGVFSVPSFKSEWFWWYWKGQTQQNVVDFMANNYDPNFTYQDFARDFTAEFFNAEQWADLFQKSGAKYIVLTSKHHEGYTLWPSKYSFSWNSMDVGPRRDLVGELANATRAKNLHFGLYHSLFEWFNPVFLQDEANNWTTTTYVDNKALPEMRELINNYLPEVLWSDGDWGADSIYWKSTQFLAWLYNDSPVKDVVVTNDRWGSDTGCKHGGFFTCADRFNPGHLMSRKWENAMTIDKTSWGYRRNAQLDEILTIEQLLSTVVQTVSTGGNVLINVGPTKEGTIIPVFQERLLQLGKWLQVNGEAVYETSPWIVQNDTVASDIWYTNKNGTVYAFFLTWPKDNRITLVNAVVLFENDSPTVTLLGNDNLKLSAAIKENHVEISLPDKSTVVSQWVWCLKINQNN